MYSQMGMPMQQWEAFPNFQNLGYSPISESNLSVSEQDPNNKKEI